MRWTWSGWRCSARSPAAALTPVLLTQLRDGELDLAVISDKAGRTFDTDGLELTHLLDDPMLVAVPREHRLAKRRTVRYTDLAEDHWIAGWQNPEDTLM